LTRLGTGVPESDEPLSPDPEPLDPELPELPEPFDSLLPEPLLVDPEPVPLDDDVVGVQAARARALAPITVAPPRATTARRVSGEDSVMKLLREVRRR
jgi:hypothetical protein